MSVAFTSLLRLWKDRCTTKNIRCIDVVWSNLGQECPSYMKLQETNHDNKHLPNLQW